MMGLSCCATAVSVYAPPATEVKTSAPALAIFVSAVFPGVNVKATFALPCPSTRKRTVASAPLPVNVVLPEMTCENAMRPSVPSTVFATVLGISMPGAICTPASAVFSSCASKSAGL